MDLILTLLRQRLITQAQLDDVLAEAEKDNESVWTELIKLGIMQEADVLCFLASQVNMPYVALDHYALDSSLVALVGEELARRYKLIPLWCINDTITVAMTDPTNVLAIDEVKHRTGYDVEPVIAPQSDIIAAIDRYYGVEELLLKMSGFAESVAPIKTLTGADTRRHPRVKINIPVQCDLPSEHIMLKKGANSLKGATLDLSRSGALIETDVFLPRNLTVQLTFDFACLNCDELSSITVEAVVVYASSYLSYRHNRCCTTYRNGMQFVAISDETSLLLEQVVDKIMPHD